MTIPAVAIEVASQGRLDSQDRDPAALGRAGGGGVPSGPGDGLPGAVATSSALMRRTKASSGATT